jgi:hypothetical protein
MEVAELVFFHLNYFSNVLEVSFRMNMDSEDEIRYDKIFFDEIKDFGFDFIPDVNDDFDSDEDYFDEDSDIEESVDEDDILTFLNEYYVVFPDKLPKSELY